MLDGGQDDLSLLCGVISLEPSLTRAVRMSSRFVYRSMAESWRWRMRDGWVYFLFSNRLVVDCGLTMGGISVAVGVWRLYGLCMVTAFVGFCGVDSISICALVYLGFGRGVLVFCLFLGFICRFSCRLIKMYVFVGFLGFIVGFLCCSIEMYVVESCRFRHEC